MAGWAQTIIIGNVGKDAEMRYLPSGVGVASFSVAVSRTWTDKATNEKKEKIVWYRVSAWRNLAETVNAYVKKGMQVMVEGELEPARAYLDNGGQPAAQLELTASTVQFLGSKNSNPTSENAEPDAPATATDDIPF